MEVHSLESRISVPSRSRARPVEMPRSVGAVLHAARLFQTPASYYSRQKLRGCPCTRPAINSGTQLSEPRQSLGIVLGHPGILRELFIRAAKMLPGFP